MNPPVSNGIQGAFFVAAFITGVIFGVLSLVFPDITEGFGCLLGGFCLSMWFLSLKDGGLIDSSTGRAIFIGCLSAGGFSLSFSHYTRTYGLIASTSFSGATATILGIDCLACAGWKEFWLYLWSINDNIFPLDTNTYPVTKNMKAELAGVVIIAVFGIVSQLRVWRMVKEHREKSAAQALEKQREQDLEEEVRGRTVEDRFQKERAQWEAAYGNKSIPDSSIASSSIATPKGSASIKEREVYATESVEMVPLPKGGVAAAGPSVTVSVLKDENAQDVDAQGNPIIYRNITSGQEIDNTKNLPHVPEATISAEQPVAPKRRSDVPPPPPVVPLPFKIPTEEEAEDVHEDNASISAVPESEHPTETERRPMSKRISDMSVTRRFSNRQSRVFSESAEALVTTPTIEDDRASSIAATVDDDNDAMSLREITPPHSPLDAEHRNIPEPALANDEVGSVPKRKVEPTVKVPDVATENVEENKETSSTPTRPTIRQSLTSSTDPKPLEVSKRNSHRDSRVRVDTLVSNNKNGSEQGQPAKSSSSNAPESHVGSLSDGVLPTRLSKVALSYRTNEWAKHLETAEKPELETLAMPAPEVILEEVSEEVPAPVSEETAFPLAGSRRTSRRVSVERSNSSIGLNRSLSTSQHSLIEQRSMTQSPPTISPAVLSRSNSSVRVDALAPLPSNTLMGQRESLMRKRTSSQSITPTSSTPNLLEQAEQENLSLAQRRHLLQHHQSTNPLIHQVSPTPRKGPPSVAQKWQNKAWATSKGAPPGFDSHQPKRTSSSQSDQKREELLAGWRNQIQDVTTPQTQAYLAEQQRVALLNERRQKELEKQQREASQQQRASMMDSMMRSGQMLDAHREAMRKMQRDAMRRAS